MANTIKIKRGKSNNLSVSNLQDGELALTLDTNKKCYWWLDKCRFG